MRLRAVVTLFLIGGFVFFILGQRPRIGPYIADISPAPTPAGPTATINGHTFRVEIADTVAKRTQGLSGRKSLSEDEGMLFLFPVASHQAFWMKDMNFPIDILWITGDVVADITQYAPASSPGTPLEKLPHYSPTVPVDKVLEVAAGSVQKYGIVAGSVVTFEQIHD